MTVFNFPDTAGRPTDGSFTWTAPNGLLYAWDGDAWRTIGGTGGDGNASITVTDDLSTIINPEGGDLAWHTVEARLYIYYQDDDSQQWVDASPAGDANDGAGSSFWNRNGTTLVPATAGDSVDIGSGNIELNADGSAKFGKATSLGNADNFNLESTANGGSLKVTGALTGSSFASYYVSGGTGHHFTGQYDNTPNFQIDHLGNVQVGGTIGTSPNITLNADGDGIFGRNVWAKDGVYIGDPINNARYITSVSVGTGSSPLYIGNAQIQVSSDRRLKENIEDTKLDALAVLQQVKVKDFTWNDPTDQCLNNRNTRGVWTGLIAQELVELLPFVVNAPRTEDGQIDEESESTWTLDQSQLCPVLIKALQQTLTRIEALEAEVQQLKGGN